MKFEPEKGDFLIMASDGLWENLTSEQAVALVGKWLDLNNVEDAPSLVLPEDSDDDTYEPFMEESTRVLPFTTKQRPSNNLTPDMAYTNVAYADEKNFVVVDDNAATHLARNALGGAQEDLLCGIFSADPPLRRKLR